MADSLAAVKSSVYAVQLGLLEGLASDTHLQAAGKLLTRSEYGDVVTERTFVNLCGYPLCTHHLPESFSRKGRYHISLREHKVYDLQEARLFCSSDCLVASQSFATSLSLERDYTGKIFELAAAFHMLGAQDVVHRHQASLLVEYDKDMLASKQEHDHLLHPETRSSAMEIGEDTQTHVLKLELDPTPMPLVEEIKQHQELTPGTFLLIHEQDVADIKVDDVHVAGPSNAIEGYVPQREFHKTKLSNNDKDEMALRHEPQEKQGGLSSNKEREKGVSRRKKKAPDRKAKDLDMGLGDGSGTEFSSCIMTDEAKPIVLEARCSSESANRIIPAENLFTSCILTNERASTQRHHLKKKQNRVSWADHNNLKLVEESSSSFVSRETSGDTCDVQVHMKERDQDSTTPFSSLGRAAIVVEECNALSSSQERLFCEGQHDDVQANGSQKDNLECAEALVAALTEAAGAVAHGYADSSEAVTRAGISILPYHEEPWSRLLDFPEKEQKESERVGADDLENADPKDCWYSSAPKDFKPELSTFGTLWMALDGWISAASIAHVYGKGLDEEDNFVCVNGKEYLRQLRIPNGVSPEIERTLAGCISRALPALVETLRFPVPVSTLELSLGRFLRTMSFSTAIPPFSSKQWKVVVLLLLDALSVHRVPALRTRLLHGRPVVQKVLDASNITEAEYEVFRDLVLPMGMLPEFAAHCGG